MLTDDLGHPLAAGTVAARPVTRVVSLVPSLTEALALSRPEAVVGATDWCTHPADLDATRVRGTKNPDLAAIRALEPQLVVANQEENRELDVARLREAGIAVWVTRIETLQDAFASLRRLFTVALGWDEPAWLGEAEAVWAPAPAGPRLDVAVPIWRDPWMVVGARTFTGDLLDRLGLRNVFGTAAERYPHATLAEISAAAPGLVILPDEPYPFSESDGPEAFPGVATRLVEGRSLTWYGPSLLGGRSLLQRQLGLRAE